MSGNAVLSSQGTITNISFGVPRADASHVALSQFCARVLRPSMNSIRRRYRLDLISIANVQMLPVQAASDPANCLTGYAKAISKLLLGSAPVCIQGANHRNGFSGKNRVSNPLAPRSALRLRPRAMKQSSGGIQSVLGFAIEDVVLAGSKEKMIGVATRRMVTRVANKQGVGISPTTKPKSHSVSANGTTTNLELTISAALGTSLPIPTRPGVADSNLGPEAISFCFGEDRQRSCSVVHEGKYTMMELERATNYLDKCERKKAL